MRRLSKVVPPYLWMAAVLFFFFLPLLPLEVSPNSPELFATERLRESILESFSLGQWPLWNPLLGPGGGAAQIFSIVPWDYHLLLKSLIPDWDWMVLFDGILMGLALLWACRAMGVVPKAAWFVFPAAFLFLYTMDFVQFQAIPLYYDSLFIAFFPLLALTYRIERGEGTRRTWLAVALLYVFSFQGSKIEVWAMQLPLVLFLWVAGLRVSSVGARFRREDLRYLGVLAVGWLAHGWQILWLRGLIEESGRAGFRGWEKLGPALLDFAKSFPLSSLVLSGFWYFGITSLLLRRKRAWWALPIVGILLWEFFPLAWLREDIVAPWPLRGIAGVFFLGLFFVQYALLVVRRRSEKLYFDFPVLLLCLAHFIFENEITFNWGVRSIEYYSLAPLFLLALGWLASLASPRAALRRAALVGLLGIYFFRAHLSVLTMRLTGVLWHNQRDTYFPSALFALLFILGAEHLLSRWKWEIPRRRIVATFALGTLGIAVMVSLQRANFLRIDSGWAWNAKPSCSTKVGQVLEKKELVGPSHRIATSPWAVLPGSFLPLGLHHVNVYDSLVSAPTKKFLASPSRVGAFREECELPYPWLPNNLQRVVNCSSAERQAYYAGLISPPFDFRSPAELSRVGASLVLTDIPAAEGLKLVEEIPECAGTPEHEGRVGLFSAAAAPLPFALFQAGVTSCEGFRTESAVPLEVATSLFARPFLKDRFDLAVPATAGGCLLFRVSHSRFWEFSIGPRKLPSSEGPDGFTKLFVPPGQVTVAARYFPALPALFALGCLVQFLLLVALGRTYASYSKSRRVLDVTRPLLASD